MLFYKNSLLFLEVRLRQLPKCRMFFASIFFFTHEMDFIEKRFYPIGLSHTPMRALFSRKWYAISE